MKRVIFKLSMPGINSWNGKWSGAGSNYYRVFQMNDKEVVSILGDKMSDSWGYNFGDGWYAEVMAEIVPKGTRLPKSDGFCGYDWMISSIKDHGEITTKRSNE